MKMFLKTNLKQSQLLHAAAAFLIKLQKNARKQNTKKNITFCALFVLKSD